MDWYTVAGTILTILFIAILLKASGKSDTYHLLLILAGLLIVAAILVLMAWYFTCCAQTGGV